MKFYLANVFYDKEEQTQEKRFLKVNNDGITEEITEQVVEEKIATIMLVAKDKNDVENVLVANIIPKERISKIEIISESDFGEFGKGRVLFQQGV